MLSVLYHLALEARKSNLCNEKPEASVASGGFLVRRFLFLASTDLVFGPDNNLILLISDLS